MKKTITVVGAGTAGSLTAAYLKTHFPNYNIRQIYTPYIPIIGVGESVTPLLVHFLKKLGLGEREWMAETDAIYKLSNCFRGWVEEDDKVFFGFTFNEPLEKILNDEETTFEDKMSITPKDHRLTDVLVDLYNSKKIGHNFDHYYNEYQPYMTKNVMPNNFTDKHSYAYHIDAEKLGPWIFENINAKIGVEQIEGKIIKVNKNENGITSVQLENGKIFESDLWIDTSGFNRILIGEIENEYVNYDHCLVNSAVVAPVRYSNPNKDCVNYTQTIWNKYGWMWKIGLSTREGRGLVYCDNFFTDEQAKEEFLRLAEGRNMREPKIIKWEPKRLVRPASKNVVAIGLAGGFVEPMEANSLDLVCAGIFHLSNALQKKTDWNTFNTYINDCLDDTADFVSIHYTLCPKEPNEFWKYMRAKGKRERHLELCKKRYNNEFNTLYWTTQMRNLFPDYMWAELAMGWRHDIKDWSKNTDEMTENKILARMLNRYEKNKKNADSCIPNYKFIKQWILPLNEHIS